MDAAKPIARAKGIQSLELGFRLVRALAEADGPLPLKQLAPLAGMSPSKARMYLVSLIRVGVIAQDEASGLYQLGPYAAELGSVAQQRSDLLASAQRAMDALAEQTGAIMLLAGWGHGGATLLRKSESAEVLPIDFRIGGHASLTRTATGLVCLAYLPARVTAAEREAELAENRLDPTLRPLDAANLDGLVAAVRATGSATVKNVSFRGGVVLVGYTAIAAPILGRDGRLRLVLTALLPKQKPKVDAAGARTLVRAAASRLSGLSGAPLRADGS